MRIPAEVFDIIESEEQVQNVSCTFEILKSVQRMLCCVDGGSAVVISAPHYAIGLVRVYASVWSEGKRTFSRGEQYFVHLKNNSGMVNAVILDARNIVLSVAIKDGQIPADAIDVVRKWCEVQCARSMLKLLWSDAVLLLDGDLRSEEPLESSALKQLCDDASQMGVYIGALSKTNRFLSENKTALVADLLRAGPADPWIARISTEIVFVKLHVQSNYVFRLDAKDAEIVAQALVPLSTDPVFIGYPYPLIEADARARVSNAAVASLRIELAARGMDVQSGRALDAHSILDGKNMYQTLVR